MAKSQNAKLPDDPTETPAVEAAPEPAPEPTATPAPDATPAPVARKPRQSDTTPAPYEVSCSGHKPATITAGSPDAAKYQFMREFGICDTTQEWSIRKL